jgi:hypothetical protein
MGNGNDLLKIRKKNQKKQNQHDGRHHIGKRGPEMSWLFLFSKIAVSDFHAKLSPFSFCTGYGQCSDQQRNRKLYR